MPPQLSAYQEDLSLVHYLDTVGDSTTGWEMNWCGYWTISSPDGGYHWL